MFSFEMIKLISVTVMVVVYITMVSYEYLQK